MGHFDKFLALSHTYKPCTLPKNKTKGSYSPKNPSKLVISTTKKYIQLEHWWSRSVGKLLKSHFNQFLEPISYLQVIKTSHTNRKCVCTFPFIMLLKCTKSAQKSYISSFWPIFGHLTHSKVPYSIKEVYVRAHNLPKASKN